ncbi:hypothetical protein G7Y89_g3225 [Cudoniella acicularis]|uniref:G-protein coupled receptors family 2 profile 2 domain-containing protein n=1 Tax=Cudoniella acicularis TaxID=354080 RepID=A0A8H4RRS9_9HELO|nr:hypothetical protein G7Y89_g3225 [Cudoniella acicularis]
MQDLAPQFDSKETYTRRAYLAPLDWKDLGINPGIPWKHFQALKQRFGRPRGVVVVSGGGGLGGGDENEAWTGEEIRGKSDRGRDFVGGWGSEPGPRSLLGLLGLTGLRECCTAGLQAFDGLSTPAASPTVGIVGCTIFYQTLPMPTYARLWTSSRGLFSVFQHTDWTGDLAVALVKTKLPASRIGTPYQRNARVKDFAQHHFLKQIFFLLPEALWTGGSVRSANWINVVGMACSMFLVVSFAFLPVEKTHRHYLSVCLAIATIMMQLGFIIPLGAKPNQCFNAITPNDMTTNTACALSGAFLIAGGWCGVMWVFLRAVALHLQICWQVVIGKMFMWGALAAGWGIPAIGVTVAIVFSGVSFRSRLFGYCIKVYLASLADDSTTTNSSGLPSYTNSIRATISPRQAYRRVRRVIELQWRGIAIVLLIIADVVFFAVVFVFMDDMEANIIKNPAKSLPWIECLALQGGNKNACLKLAEPLVISEATVMSVLLLLSLNGIWCLCLLGRTSMFTGWYGMVLSKVKPNNEFISADVRQYKDPTSYEMLSRDRDGGKTPEPFTSPTVTPLSPTAKSKSGRETPDYFGRQARYTSPVQSFSVPKPPNQGADQTRVGWDPTTTHAQPIYYTGMDPLAMNKI